MIRIEKMIKIENKYKNMDNGVFVLSEKVKHNDTIETMTSNFRILLTKKNVSFLDTSVLSDIFSFSLVMFEEAMEEERKERFFEFVSATFSKEFLRGKEEILLFDKMLKRMGRKIDKEDKENKLKNNL